MKLPWFLNPWAEVRRLRAELKWRDHMRLDMAKAWRDERRENYQRIREANVLKDENAELKRKVAELHVYCSCLEGKGVVRHVPPSSEELLKRVQGDPRVKFCL